MLLDIHPINPEKKKVKTVSEILMDRDGVVVLPTDTIYGLVARPGNRSGKDRIFQIKDMPKNQYLSLFCYDLKTISLYARNVSNKCFKLLKRVLPGPYTFIFNATKKVPKMFLSKKGTIGIKIPENRILLDILKEADSPLISTSVLLEEKWYNDPEKIHNQIGKQVDLVVDGGIFPIEPSTVVNCTNGDPVIERIGKGAIDIL